MSDAAPDETGTPPADDRWARFSSNVTTIGGAFLFAFLIRIVFFETFQIEGSSMEPTFLNGDRIVVEKFPYGLSLPRMSHAVWMWGEPEVGDIVIVRSPADPRVELVKRVVGVPGDTVEMRDYVVYRNGVAVTQREIGPCKTDEQEQLHDLCVVYEESFVEGESHLTSRQRNPFGGSFSMLEPTTVPEGHVLVLGDHRDTSNDSRNPDIGAIPTTFVRGRAVFIYWSWGPDGPRWDRVGGVR
jgi:signal peptidase I